MRFARLAVVAVSALAAGLSAQTTRLEFGKTIPGDLSGGKASVYSVTLAAGQYLHAEFKTVGADLIVGLRAPAGDMLLEVNTLDFPAKTAPVYFVADSAGDYRIELKAQGQTSAHYEVRTEQHRKPSAKDRNRAEAERFFFRAQTARNKRAFKEALDFYERALRLDREAGDRRGEGAALLNAGLASFDSEQTDRAAVYYGRALVIARKFKDPRGEGRVLGNLSNVYERFSEYDKVLACAE